MIIDTITKKFIDNPANLRMGAGKLAKRWNCSKEDIYSAREKARTMLKSVENTGSLVINQPAVKVSTKADSTIYIGSETSDDHSIKKFESSKPLSPDEIKKLVGVDGISTTIHKVIDRMLPNGNWAYSVDIRYSAKDFFNKEELKKKLAEIFPTIKPVTLPVVKRFSEKMAVLLISDDHAGAVNDNPQYSGQWTTSAYKKRLLKLVNELKALGQKYEEIHIISLGDQMNGWNSQTTRGGHEVKSLSNKDQFEMYTSARVAFYNDLFMSGIGANYYVHDVENSNHTGNDFSYMANKFLEMYLESKFPQVTRNSYFSPIEYFEYGIHVVGFTHGKDEKLVQKPMPMKLDPRTDLYLYQFFDKRGLSSSDRRITLYKGDLHSYTVDKGKFGRYINVPSIMGGTDWTEANFGYSEAGAMIEIYEKSSNVIQHFPVWF